MRSPSRKRFLLTSLLFFSVNTALAQGYFNGTKGARSDGRAGAVTVKADDLSAVEYNPAGLARMRGSAAQFSNRFAYNYSAFSRDVTIDYENVRELTAFYTVENQLPLQGIDPMLGISTDFGLQDWGFALAAYAPAGVGRMEFPLGPTGDQMPSLTPPGTPVDGGQRYMMVKRDAAILTYAASVAWKFKELFGLGVTAQWIHVPHLDYALVVDGSTFNRDANPVANNFDILSTVSVSDPFTFNLVVGGWLKALPFLEFGASAQVVPSQIEADGELQVSALNFDPATYPLEIRQGANGGYTQVVNPAKPDTIPVRLTLPLPLTFRAGVRYIQEKVSGEPLFDIELDAIYQTWSAVDEFFVNTNPNGLPAGYSELRAFIEGAGDAPIKDARIQKQWKDTLTLRLGSDWHALPFLTARAGVAYETAVAPKEYLHVDFSAGEHITGALGASFHFRPLEIGISYSLRHMLQTSVSEADGLVFQEVPGSNCDPVAAPDRCHPSLVPPPEGTAEPPGQPTPTVNGGRYTAFTHALSLDVIYRF